MSEQGDVLKAQKEKRVVFVGGVVIYQYFAYRVGHESIFSL